MIGVGVTTLEPLDELHPATNGITVATAANAKRTRFGKSRSFEALANFEAIPNVEAVPFATRLRRGSEEFWKEDGGPADSRVCSDPRW
jgi:hypothetical protein